MNSGVYVAVSGAKLQELRLEITANNLANVNTSGYKADKLASTSFDFQLAQALEDVEPVPQPFVDEQTPYDVAYAKTLRVGTNFSQGNTQVTGNPLNIALEGPGFIAIETPNGVRYTRQGNFAIDSTGKLLTSDGLPVRGKGLTGLDQGDITIDTQGNVIVNSQNQGSLEIVEFENPEVLVKEGHNLFLAPPHAVARPKPAQTMVHQGSLEMSNVNVVSEMVTMIELNRMYQAYQKMITALDECTGRLIEAVVAA